MRAAVSWNVTLPGGGCATYEVETTRAAVRHYWKHNHQRVNWMQVDICLTRYTYTRGRGWRKQGMFNYVPNRPDLWNLRK